MEYFIFWIFGSIVAGVIAGNKGRSGVGFFFLALLLSPVVGIISALIVKRDAQVQEQHAILNEGMKRCPFCAEVIKGAAVVCRYCGRDLPEKEPPKSTEEDLADPADGGCLVCGVRMVGRGMEASSSSIEGSICFHHEPVRIFNQDCPVCDKKMGFFASYSYVHYIDGNKSYKFAVHDECKESFFDRAKDGTLSERVSG